MQLSEKWENKKTEKTENITKINNLNSSVREIIVIICSVIIHSHSNTLENENH